MRGAALPRDRSQLRTSSGKETITRCKAEGNLDDDDVVVIDVECDTFPYVILVDEPGHWKKKFHGSNASRGDQRVPFEGVISIDDDDDDVGTSGVGVEGSREGDGDGDDDDDDDDVSILWEKGAPDESKLKQAYSTKVPGRNRYGLSSESESGSSDSDCSDCELIDSSFEKFHELWEKAFHNRRNGVRSCQVDRPSASGHYSDSHIGIRGENQQIPNGVFEKEKQSAVFETGESNPGQIASTSRSGSPKESDESTEHLSFRCEPTTGIPFLQSDHNVAENKKLDEPEVSDEQVGFLENGKPSEIKDGDDLPSLHEDIINDREKLKGTDEYKRAIEEEWASRQQQLQIQAEEVQRLKKRKKAETLRLLDMERRQKQRVEEVRETQKKDEEHMNLKDQLRVEIRKELNILEITSINMASILRGLGIPVGGGFRPTSNEVHAAYKRALLKFHPDRASRTDIRLQVEAEEKFKVISRMKEKYLS